MSERPVAGDQEDTRWEVLDPDFKVPGAVDLDVQDLKVEHDPNRVQYEILDRPEKNYDLKARYLRLTGDLVKKTVESGSDVMVFLDKSARPVAWMVQELWEDFAPDQTQPEIKFINIDSAHWRGDVISENGIINANEAPKERIEQLQKVFADLYDPEKSMFDQKSLMIVDEVKNTGETLRVGKALFARAFPRAKEINGAWWMIPSIENNRTADMPVWYDASLANPRGEYVGVANRGYRNGTESSSYRQIEGKDWLSEAQPDGPSKTSVRLRKEIKQMAQDYRDGLIQPEPSYQVNFDSSLAKNKH